MNKNIRDDKNPEDRVVGAIAVRSYYSLGFPEEQIAERVKISITEVHRIIEMIETEKNKQ